MGGEESWAPVVTPSSSRPPQVSKDVLLKIREREGSRRPKPLWTDVMDLAGGEYGEFSTKFYE